MEKLNDSKLFYIVNGFVADERLSVFLQPDASSVSWMPGRWESKRHVSNYCGMVREEAAPYGKPKPYDFYFHGEYSDVPFDCLKYM